jgi:hypothetical protein
MLSHVSQKINNNYYFGFSFWGFSFFWFFAEKEGALSGLPS